MLGGKKKYKCRFEVKVEKIEGLPDKVKGNPFRVEYARGKDHTGISRTLTMTSKNMAVNYSFKFDSNLLFEEKKGARKFSEKSLTFQVVAEKSKDVKKDTNIGKVEFDLSTVAVPGEFEAKQRLECHGKDKSDTKCILVVSFKTEVLKIDGKKLVKKDPSKASSSSSKTAAKSGDDPYDDLPDFGDDPAAAAAGANRTVQVDGQEYDLQTDMDLSEGGMDSDGDAKTENDYLSDSDEKADPFEQDAELTEDEQKLAKKLEDEENDAAAKKKADDAKEAKKKADAEAAAKAEADKKAAADADKKLNDDKKSKEEEKKRKEEEDKKRKEDEKKKKEEEKRAKEEEDKRKKEEEKKRKEDEKRAKEEEDKRKKQEKADLKAGIVPSVSASSVAAAAASASTNSSAPNSARDSKDSNKSASTSTTSSSTSAAASVAGASALEAKLKQVQEDRDKAQAEVKRLTEALDDEKSRAATLKKEVKSNETTIKELEAKLKREESKNDDLEADVRRLNERGGGVGASAVSAAATSASTSSSDASEITWLEGQLRKVRAENEELHGDVDNLKHRLQVQEEIVEQHDAGYAAKCIADLETENAKLRKKLDDADLLKGDLMQELKHRQSERTIRVEQHHKDVAAGTAAAEEMTGYKRHSRQSSMDSASGSATTSPRTNGSSTAKDAKKDTKADRKDAKKVDEKPAPAPPKEPKKSAISMDEDAAPVTASRSKRAGGSILPIAEEGENAFASADNSAALAALETKLKHVESIEAWLYNAKMDYDEDGWATAAQQMSEYIVRAQRALHRKEQHSESAYSLLVHMLSAIYGQSQRHAEDLDVLVGLFQWCVTLLQQLQRESDTLEDAPAGSYMTWAVDIDNCGCILTFDAMIDAQETMANGKFQVGKSFDDISADATPGEAFLKLLDQLTSYVYTLIFSCLQTVIDEQRLTDLFFGQTAQLAAAMNPNSSRANGSGSGNRKPAPPRPMASFTAQLDVFLSSARRHRLPKVIEAQMLGQFFYWCSCTIVNALVRSGEHCSAMVGMSLKVAVSHVEQWISQNSPRKLAGWVEDQFAATREAANVLTIDKHIFQSIDALEGIFTTLNIAQIHKLLTQFQPDDFAPDAVPRTTLDVLRNTINKTNAKVTYLDGTVLVGLSN